MNLLNVVMESAESVKTSLSLWVQIIQCVLMLPMIVVSANTITGNSRQPEEFTYDKAVMFLMLLSTGEWTMVIPLSHHTRSSVV